jgi:hypothetical protein
MVKSFVFENYFQSDFVKKFSRTVSQKHVLLNLYHNI